MVELLGEYDVVVAGGGTSGVAAAISSARAGANTLLVERLGALGGQMNVSGPPGFSYAHMFNARYEQVIGGIMEETHARLLKEGHALPHLKPDFRAGYSFSYVDPDWWGLLMFEMMQENSVHLLLHSLAVDVLKQGDAVRGVIVENTSGRQLILGKVIIDCTGEGDISVRAGAPFEQLPKEQLQPHTLSFTVDGVDWDKVLKYIKENLKDFTFNTTPYLNWTEEQVHERIKQVGDIAEIGEQMGWISLRDKAMAKGEWHGQSGVGFFLIPREGGVIQAHFQHSNHVSNIDPTDARDLTYGEIEARRQIRHSVEVHQEVSSGLREVLHHEALHGAEGAREQTHHGRLRAHEGRCRRGEKIRGCHRQERFSRGRSPHCLDEHPHRHERLSQGGRLSRHTLSVPRADKCRESAHCRQARVDRQGRVSQVPPGDYGHRTGSGGCRSRLRQDGCHAATVGEGPCISSRRSF